MEDEVNDSSEEREFSPSPEPRAYRWSNDNYDDEFVEHEDHDESIADEENNSVHDEEEEEQPQNIIEKCLKLFSTPDFIMESEVFSVLTRYFQSGGDPAPVIELMSKNYVALSQICNIMAEWLSLLGCDATSVQTMFETHLQSLIMKHFDPKKADTIFNQQAEGQIEWLPEVIAHAPWRVLIYQLSEQYPECLMLNFAIKLISDAGYENEISNVTTATQQLDIFSRVLCSAVNNVLQYDVDSLNYQNGINELAKIVGHGEHTYLYTQALLHSLTQEPKSNGSAAQRLAQELREIYRPNAPETTDIALALHNSSSSSLCNPSIIQAMHSMFSRNALNPADVSVLYSFYNNNDPPPVEIIRDQVFLDMLIDALFRPKNKLNPDHRPKYIYLLAYAASVVETFQKGQRKQHSRDEVKTTQQAIEKCHNILMTSTTSIDLLAELQSIFTCLRYPVVAAGVLNYVKCVVTDVDYFKLHPEAVPVDLALLDEIASLHPLLHNRVFALLNGLFETEQDGVDTLVQLERRRMLIDRLVHLLSTGYSLPVTNYMKQKLQKHDTDVSLIRYFVTETLEIISPPYSAEFVETFLPLVENAEICRQETMSDDKWEAIQSFLSQCKS